MLNLHRSLLLALTGAVLAACVSAGYGQDADADKAKSLLSQGVAQYNALDFRQAKETLQQVQREHLSAADQKTLDEYLGGKVDEAIAKQDTAATAYAGAQEALKAGKLQAARDGFIQADSSDYLPAETRKDAAAQLALVNRKIEIAEIAALQQPRQTEPAEQPVEAPAAEAAVPQPVEAAAPDQPKEEPAGDVKVVEVQPLAGKAAEAPAEPVAETPAEPAAEAPAEPVAEAPAEPAAETPAEPVAEAPAEPVAEAPAEPVAETPAEPAPEPQDKKLLEVLAARRAQAQDLVVLGQQALDDNQPEQAAGYFQRALALDPNNEQIRKQLNYARQLTTDVGEAGILPRLQRNRRIARQTADVEFDKEMRRSQEVLARAGSAADFGGAADAARVAQNILETNKNLYSAQEYGDRLARLQTQLSLIDQSREEWNLQRVRAQEAEIREKNLDRIRVEEQRRTEKIETLKGRAQTLKSERKYDQALEVVQQIVGVDPNDQWAADQIDWLEQFVMLGKENDVYRTQRKQEQQELLDLRRSEIPWWEWIKYPEDWKELTYRREPFGAEHGAESETDRAVRQKLRTKLPRLDFDGIEFKDVVQFLRDVSGLNIVPKWNALSLAGIDQAQTVNVHLADVTIEKALRVILEDVGGVTPLGFIIDEGVITVSTKDDLSTKTTTEVYDIRDLIIRVPNFEAPTINLGEAGQGGNNNAGGTGGGGFFGNGGDNNASNEENLPTRGEIIANIMELITNTIEPDSWRPTGDIGSIRELSGQLVVTQTPENHQALRDLIAKLREARALQISIEARFISVSSGFLTSIGVDLDFFFNLGSRLGSGSVVDPFTGAVVPTATGASGWGTGKPGDDKWTPLAVSQGHSIFTNMVGVSSPVGNSIGSQVTNQSLSLGGTFLDDIQVNFLIQATQANAKTRSLTAPRLTLFNGQRAYVMVATQQAYVSDLEPVVSDNVIAYNTTVDYVPTGSLLDVEATISADRRYVTLTVRPQVSALNGFTTYFTTVTSVDAEGNPLTGTGYIQLPNVTLQQLETTVSVPDGGTLLLGGQRLAGEVEREQGVPLLNKVPILNRAFTNSGMIRDEQTLLILIKPKIIIQREEEERQFPE